MRKSSEAFSSRNGTLSLESLKNIDIKAILSEEEKYCKEHHCGHEKYARDSEEFDCLFIDPSSIPSAKDTCYACTTAKPSKYPIYRRCVECGFGGPMKSKGLYTCRVCGEAYCNALCRDIHRESGCMSIDGK